MKTAKNKTAAAKIAVAGGIGLLAMSLLFVGRAHAQQGSPDQPPPYDQQGAGPQQPPDSQQPSGPTGNEPGVARVSFIHGDVSMQRGDSGEGSTATVNTPLEAGDKLLTGDDSRTELELDAADILRLDQNAAASIATLANNRIQIQVGQGVANFSVMKGGSADVEVDTPNVAVHPLREGRYRVFVNPDGTTIVTIRDGEAQISTAQGSTKVRKGDLITIRGMGDDAQYKVSSAPGNDDFDRWNTDRDRIIYDAHSWDHTNRNYTGTHDLDSYGVWDEVPDYGQVWVPSVDAGWAPYRAGRWVYEPYWGWTWVSGEPWGWAPYHYGRWFLYGSRWAWWPGPVYGGYRPVWAPAYVSFFGFGGGVGVSFGAGFGFGNVGWLPIGPCDYYHPWWGGYRDRFSVVEFNRFNEFHDGFRPLHGGDRFSNFRDVEHNDRLRAGVSGVPAGGFGRGGVAARAVSADEFRGARAMTGNVPVVPGRESLRASDRPVNASLSARGAQQQRFFSRMTPGARPESFSQAAMRTQQGLQRNNIQFHGNAEVSRGPETNGAPGNAGPNRGAANGVAAKGGRPFGGNNTNNGSPSYRPPQNGAQQGRDAQGGFNRGQGQVENSRGQNNGNQSGAGQNGAVQNNGNWNRFGGGQGQPQGESRQSGQQPTYRPQTDGQSQTGVQPRVGGQSQAGGPSQIYRGNSPRSYEGQGQPDRQEQQPGGGWQRFSGPRGAETSPRSGGNAEPNNRPQLNMNRPIVTERSPRENPSNNAGGNQGNRGGYPGNSGGRAERPSYQPSAPSPAYRTGPGERGTQPQVGGNGGGSPQRSGGSSGGGSNGGGYRMGGGGGGESRGSSGGGHSGGGHGGPRR